MGAENTGFDFRLTAVLEFCRAHPRLYPFFWIDPLEPDAADQVIEAVKRGIHGFKIICNAFYPGDEKALALYRLMAHHQKPLLFHSGILWDGTDSSKYNRPVGFEALLNVEGLKFTLAHMSWPWCDECFAVYGKFLSAYTIDPQGRSEIFLDITPGTPRIYREEALTKLFGMGCDVADNVVFGTDCPAHDYSVAWAGEWIARDEAIMDKLGVSSQEKSKVFADNLLRFLGETDVVKTYTKLSPVQEVPQK